MSVMRDDEQNAAAKSNVALLSLAQAKPHEARRRKCLRSSVVSSFLVFFFSRIFASTQIASDITQTEVHFLGREAATESGERAAIERTAMGKTDARLARVVNRVKVVCRAAVGEDKRAFYSHTHCTLIVISLALAGVICVYPFPSCTFVSKVARLYS